MHEDSSRAATSQTVRSQGHMFMAAELLKSVVFSQTVDAVAIFYCRSRDVFMHAAAAGRKNDGGGTYWDFRKFLLNSLGIPIFKAI
jgi:hypothetical protein